MQLVDLLILLKMLNIFRNTNDEQSNFIRVFDDDNSGAMDFAEYMLAINATNLNTPQACFIKSFYHQSRYKLLGKTNLDV